jgi:DNA-binding MarR family transcriptional regulator
MALVQTSDASIAMVNRALRRHGLSAAGRQALAVLEGAGQPLSPPTISERLIVSTASVTSLLDTLERRGLVIRLPDPDDRRRLLVSLTDEGQRVVDEFLPEVVALQTAVMEPISEPDRQRLLRSLAAIRAAIRAAIAAVDVEAVVSAAPRRVRPQRS